MRPGDADHVPEFFTVTVKEAHPEIIVSSHVNGGDSSDVHRILTMGAAGILLQDTAAQHVPWVVPGISSGCRVVSPEISESVISEYLRSSATTSQEESAREIICRLSRREQEVLHLVAQGMSNREIASALFISPETVKDHVRAIRAKLGAPTRVHAARVAWLAHSASAGSAA